ncbi:CU044_5270 family protein [Streptomyces sp. KL118A]|uniref:CU044_5270 family protein n=1 Tax=Streptomyces sp. KL118A TaxID=3045153 RepID=UPI00278C0B3F|nr:CU044_5270 family protein [Streptomyces sp. KL118A]
MNDFPERDLPPGRHHLLKEHLLTEIRQSGATAAAPKKNSKIWFRPALATGALAAAVVAGLLVASPFGDQAAQAGPPSEETVRMLEQIAAAAEKQPEPKGLRDDQFVYIRTKERYMETGSDETARIQPLHVREYWESVDGRHTEVVDDRVDGFDHERMPPDLPLTEGDSHYRSLQKLPTDPVNMRDWLYRVSSGGESRDQNAFVLVGDLCGGLMPPKQAAALYLAASKIPGVEVREDAVDAAGRHGVAIARENDGERQELIFDKETKQFLGERQVAAEDLPTGFKKGTVTGHSAVLERVVVDKAGRRP